MQFFLHINQATALEWGLNAQQAMLFAWLYEVPSWADTAVIDDIVFYNVAKTKIISELPLLTDKPDTAYRLLKQLQEIGVIQITSQSNKTYFRMTEKSRNWNFQGPEKYPSLPVKGRKNIRTKVGKISELGSEKSPTNHNTNNQDTNNHKNNTAPKRRTKTQAWKEFFAAYPPNKKGGNDSAAWNKAKSLKLSDEDFELIRNDVLARKEKSPAWYNTYALGICKYLSQEIWKTPIQEEPHASARPTATGKPSLAERQEAQGRAALDLIGLHEASSSPMDSDGAALPQQMGIPRGTSDDCSGWSGTPVFKQRQVVGEKNPIPA